MTDRRTFLSATISVPREWLADVEAVERAVRDDLCAAIDARVREENAEFERRLLFGDGTREPTGLLSPKGLLR